MLEDNPMPFVCKSCMETITQPQNFSKIPKLCFHCYLRKEALRKNKCLVCGEPNPVKEYWGQCKECFFAPIEDEMSDEETDWEDSYSE
jgi:hypothetical protein